MGKRYYTNPSMWFDEKRGKYRGQMAHRDENGKRILKRVTLKSKGKRAATAEFEQWCTEEEAKAQANAGRGEYGLSIADTPIADYIEQFIGIKESSGAIEPSTASDYRNSNKRIRKAFPNTRVSEVNSLDVQQWEADMLANNLSSSTVGKCHRILKEALTYAVLHDAINKNPLDLVKPPRRENKKEGINALDEPKYNLALDKLNGLKLTPVIMAAHIALQAGLRRAEVCGLQWRDIDFNRHTLSVKRSIGIKKGGAYVKVPKTRKGREVYMTKTLESLLMKWKEQQRERFSESLATLHGDSFVIGYPAGYKDDSAKWYNPTRLTKEWKALAETFDIEGVESRNLTFHDLRHTHATIAIANGADVKSVSSQLGHANASQTLDIYASACPDALRREAEIMESAIGFSTRQVG